MITRGQVADLREGDVVELRSSRHPGVVVTGPLRDDMGHLSLGPNLIRCDDGSPTGARDMLTLTVISRAPRPLYVNHPRTEPVPGDTAHPGDGTCSVAFRTVSGWIWPNGTRARVADHGLRLLVDGETGMTVPSELRPDVSKNDPTPEWANANPGCAAPLTPFACTREPGHPGQHIAGTGVGNPVAAVWS